MKNNKNRTSSNGSATRAPKQAATVTKTPLTPKPEPTTLVITCEGREIARIEYSAVEFDRFERARAALNCSLEEFFEAAVKEKLPTLEAGLGATAARKAAAPTVATASQPKSEEWKPCDTDKLWRDGLMINGAFGKSPLREELWRDMAGRLLVTRFDQNSPQFETVVREIAYAEACDWLARLPGSPEHRLAKYGIVGREPTAGEKPVAPASREQGQLSALAEALGLSAAQHLALDLISQWESMSPLECCRDGVGACLDSAFDDLESAATNSIHRGRPATRREQAWALKFYPRLKRLFRETGFENAYNATPAADAADNAPAFEREALRMVAEFHGRMTVEELEGQAEDLELQSCQARAAARAVTRDPLAWDLAGAMNTASDGSPIVCAVAGRGRAMNATKRSQAAARRNGGKAGAR